MKERNRDSLRRALDRLPQYDPPPRAWEGVEAGLAKPAADGKSATPLPLAARLPEYSPPASVWNQINEQLNQPVAASGKRFVLRRIPAVAWRSAAAVVLIVASFAIVQAFDRGPEVSYSYRKETNFEPTLVADWHAEEPQFEEMISATADSDNPAVNRLRTELEELTSARSDVEAMLDNYGSDPQLVRQLGEIERERSEVYRQLIAYR